MAFSPIVTATIQSAVIGAFSNVVAQAITAYRNDMSLVIDWIPIFQFFLFGCVCTPPNFMWQEFLESTFPAYHIAPTAEAISSASAGDDKELVREAREGRLVERRLSKRNTLIKTVLDQTVGAALNTLLFSTFMHGIRAAMAHRAKPEGSLAFLVGLSGHRPVRPEDVNWTVVWARARAEFWDLIRAGWSFWPFVSLVNYVFLTSVEARNLVGSLAGLGWGVYVSLFAAA